MINYDEQFNQDCKEISIHWNMGREAARNTETKINDAISTTHQQYPDWSINKIAQRIYIKCENLEGFSTRTIYRSLNEEHKQLLDLSHSSNTSRKKVLEQSVDSSCQPNVIEDSSMSETEPEISDDEANEILQELPEPTEELQEEEVIYDKGLLNKHVKEIAKLQEENAQLKIDRIPTRSNKFEFGYDVEFTDEMYRLIKANSGICPFICTSFPDKGDGWIRFDKEKIEREIKEANKKK